MRSDAGGMHERPLREAVTSDLSVIEAQLIEAACRVRDGDREAAREYVAHAMALLYRKPSSGAVHGLQVVNLYHAVPAIDPPPTYRSLSRREAGVLQMIARGMSNTCIARSLGIAPETVKTHAKGILASSRHAHGLRPWLVQRRSACFDSSADSIRGRRL
jgi:DNA-binding NarL/FixJ family response regulator